MLGKIIGTILVLLLLFLGYVSSRPSRFLYSRSGVINAPAEKIFPYLSNLKMGPQWNPYDQKDPNMKRTYGGNEGQVGQTVEFESKETGTGKLEVMSVAPNQHVQIRLTMIKPFPAENLIDYTLTPEGTATRFMWAMSGDPGFMGKLFSVFVDCEKMFGEELQKGVNNLKTLVESQK